MMKMHRNNSISASRRNFLKTGSGATAGLIVSLNDLASARHETALGEGATMTLQPPSPEWTRDLIIYEIATKGFTSPNGPESGTFNSLIAKLPYLQELGITAIWLGGQSLADAHHFYNIWTQYANIEPDKIDPTLGTPEEFKSLIAEAHKRGMRIFLDVHVHGILSVSPLIKQHPHWFRGGSWRMTDYDYFGGHTDFDDWWVKVWTDYVTQFGVDGFRLDVSMFRPDLWVRIRQNAAAAGHPIVIWEEEDAVIPGVSDFTQHDHLLRPIQPDTWNESLVRDVPGFYDRKFGRAGDYRVEIQYADDGSRVEGSVSGKGPLRVRLDGLTADKICRRLNDLHADGIPDVQLTVENVTSRPIEDIIVSDDMGAIWQYRWGTNPNSPEYKKRQLALEGEPPTLRIYLATLAHGWPSLQFSCHDEGWEGWPEDKSPYVAQGSRALFGYSCLFTPMIPICFAGEDFDATFRPIPWLSPHLFGGQEPGKGRWLYGNMLDWDELKSPRHAAMLDDVKKMIAVRKREAAILAVPPSEKEPKLRAVPHEADIPVPVPYIRWNDRGAIIVAANRETTRDASLKMRVPLEEIGLSGHASYKVTDLWPTGEMKIYTESELASFVCAITPDKMGSGGLRVFKFEPNL